MLTSVSVVSYFPLEFFADGVIEHRVEAQAFAKAITDIKDEKGNQRYTNFK